MATTITLKFVVPKIDPQHVMDKAIFSIQCRFPEAIFKEASFDPPLNVSERFSDGSPVNIYEVGT
jgi:hypothetical protein